MSTVLRITVEDEAVDKMRALKPGVSDTEVVQSIIEAGIRCLSSRPPTEDDRPVGEMTVRELARMLGVNDVVQARDNAAKHAAATGEAMTQAMGIMGDMEGLRALVVPGRFTTAKEVTEWAATCVTTMQNHAGAQLVLAAAWVQDDGTMRPAAGTDKRAN